MPKCLFDGHPFEGDGYSFPNMKKQSGKFGFDECTHCSPSCAKGYISLYLQASPHLLNWLSIHVHRDLGIEDFVPTAPNPRLLSCNRRDGKGLTIEQFRHFQKSHKLAEKINHLPIDKRVWVQGPQTNCEFPFYEVVRSECLVAEMLFKDHRAKGLTIPKTLLNDEKKKDELLKAQEEEKKRNLEDLEKLEEIKEVEQPIDEPNNLLEDSEPSKATDDEFSDDLKSEPLTEPNEEEQEKEEKPEKELEEPQTKHRGKRKKVTAQKQSKHAKKQTSIKRFMM